MQSGGSANTVLGNVSVSSLTSSRKPYRALLWANVQTQWKMKVSFSVVPGEHGSVLWLGDGKPVPRHLTAKPFSLSFPAAESSVQKFHPSVLTVEPDRSMLWVHWVDPASPGVAPFFFVHILLLWFLASRYALEDWSPGIDHSLGICKCSHHQCQTLPSTPGFCHSLNQGVLWKRLESVFISLF